MTDTKKSFKKIASKKTTKKATKKTSKGKKFFSKTRVEKPEFSVATVTEYLKNNQELTCLKNMFQETTVDQQVRGLTKMINSSRLRAYSLALKKFNFVINDFRKTGNKDILDAYLKQLGNEYGKEARYHKFTDVRHSIIMALRGNNIELINDAENLIDTLSYADDIEQTEDNIRKTTKELVLIMCEVVWPEETKGLRILHGKSK